MQIVISFLKHLDACAHQFGRYLTITYKLGSYKAILSKSRVIPQTNRGWDFVL